MNSVQQKQEIIENGGLFVHFLCVASEQVSKGGIPCLSSTFSCGAYTLGGFSQQKQLWDRLTHSHTANLRHAVPVLGLLPGDTDESRNSVLW